MVRFIPVQDIHKQTFCDMPQPAEHKQTHPIAQAILHKAYEQQVDIPAMSQVTYVTGFGIEGMVPRKNVAGENKTNIHLLIGSENLYQTKKYHDR